MPVFSNPQVKRESFPSSTISQRSLRDGRGRGKTRRPWFVFLLLMVGCFISGCGRYAPPLAPEDLSPQAVSQLKVTTGTDGVHFAWTAPEHDQRDKDLRSLDEYRIYRKVINAPSDVTDPRVEYALLATLPDASFAELERLRDEAKAAGKSLRAVKIPEEKKHYQYIDKSAVAGVRYAYQVMAVNQGDVKGDQGSIIQVVFRGDASEVVLIPVSQIEDQLF